MADDQQREDLEVSLAKLTVLAGRLDSMAVDILVLCREVREMAESVKAFSEFNKPERTDSLRDQLLDLKAIAVREGMKDAAEWLERVRPRFDVKPL